MPACDDIGVLSFLRARPDGPTATTARSGLRKRSSATVAVPFTVLKAGVIHGRGDHMLDHLSHALQTFPAFGLVGLRERPVRPVAVDDVARILEAAATGDDRLHDRTFAVVGPEEMPLGEAVRRVARVVGRRPVYVRLPVAVHLAMARIFEALMHVPLIAVAQVHILAEGAAAASPAADEPPADLTPGTPFSDDVIRAGLPGPGGFGLRDLRWWRA